MLEKTRSHIPLITLGTVLCLGSLLAVIFFSDPYTSGISGHIFFYLSLFLTIIGITTAIGIIVRQRFGTGMYVANVSTSFRQGIFVAVLITTSLLLLSYDLLFWWVELTLLLFLVFLELFLTL